jgi:hypothetical protein
VSIKIEYKPQDELLGLLNGVERIFILRCAWCGASSGATADPVFEKLEAFLRERRIQVEACWVAALCAHSILYQRVRQFRRRIRKADAIGVCSCSMGVKSLLWITDGTKRVVPFCDTVGAGGREVDWEHMGGPETCIPGCVCVLGVTHGICTAGSCPSKRRTPCVAEDQLVESCREDETKVCPFYRIREEGRLDALLGFEQRLVTDTHTRVPLFPPLNPPAGLGRYRKRARVLGSLFGRISAPFSWLMNLYGH